MAAEGGQFNYVISLGLRENGVVQQAVSIEDRIQSVFSKLNSQSMRIGGLDQTAAERFGNQLHSAIEKALRVDVQNSPLFQKLRPVTQDLVLKTTPTDTSRFLSNQLRLTQAELAREQYLRKAAVPLGGTSDAGLKGFRTKDERYAAEIRTAKAVEDANIALANAKKKYLQEFNAAAAREIAEFHAEQVALGRTIVAIDSRTAAQKAADQRALDAINKVHYRRMQAEDKLTRAEEEAARKAEERTAAAAEADRSAARFRTSYPSADVTTPVGRSQASVNRAEATLEVATRNLATLRLSENRTAEQIISGERAVASATAALAGARERLAQAETRAAGSSFAQQFAHGFRGQSERPYAEQIGQAVKFSVFYGTAYKLLFAFTQTLQQTLQEGIAFQQAVTELKLSAGRADDSMDALANQLGQRSVEAGFAPSQGVLVGARSLGLYGATEAPAAEQERIADISARVVSRLALSSGQAPADLQTNIAAIVQAFGGGPEAQFRVADLDAYMAHKFGVAPGSTIQSVSEAGTVGRAAGFNQEQVNAIAADLMARTGQTAPAVAGFMAQIFSRGGEGSLTAVAGKYGIDPTLQLSEQIKELARVYKDATPQERAQLSAAFGRGKVQNAAIALLQDYSSVESAAAEARGGAATGAADKSFTMRLQNIGGQIALTTGVMKEFANQLGQSGLLSALGAGIVVFREIVQAGTGLLRLWNELNPVVRSAIASIALLAAAAKTSAISQALASRGGLGGLLASGLGTFRSAGGQYAGGAIAAGRIGVIAESGATAALASRAGIGIAARNAAGALVGLVGPAGLAIGGLLAVGALKSTADKLNQAQADASVALDTKALGPDATSDDYRARAAALHAAATDARDSSDGIMSRIFTWKRSDLQDSARELDAESKRLNAAAVLVERGAADVVTASTGLISGFDADGLSSSMQLITTSGGTAAERMDALRDSILGTADAAERAANTFDARASASTMAGGLYDAILGASPEKADFGFGYNWKDQINNKIRDYFSQGTVEGVLGSKFQDLGSLGDLTGAKAGDIANTLVDSEEFQKLTDYYGTGENGQKGFDALKPRYVKAIKQYLLEQSKGTRELLKGHTILSDPEVTNAINSFAADAQEQISGLAETDYKGRIGVARQLITDIKQAIAHSANGATPQAIQQLAVARRLLANSQFEELEATRKAQQQNAKSRAEVARIGHGILRKEINAAIRGNDPDLLAKIIGQAGSGAIAIARQAIREAMAAAAAAQAIRIKAMQAKKNAEAALASVRLGEHVNPGGVLGLKDPKHLQPLLDSLDTDTTSGGAGVYTTGSDVPGYEPPDTSETEKDKETAAERRAARMAAEATRSESAIAQARAEMASARAAMAKAKKGTVEYYDALSSYYDARNALTDAILDYRQNKMLLGIDMTDPLAQARVALRAARQKLRSDRGKGADVRAADLVALRNAEADREAQAFQQRLDAVQTAEQLGRISHLKYIQYLENESRRLNRIKDRTYQQQQELDQIDGLLKEAASAMDAQWNFGDIKLPTPYQVRRYIEETTPDRGKVDTLGQQHVHPTTIYIDGADTGAVKRIIDQYVGRAGRVLTTAPRRH